MRPDGEPVADTATVPAKPFRLDRLTVEVEVDPALRLRDAGLAEILKSGGGEVGLKNSLIAVAPASPVLRLAKLQFVSIVFGKE